MTSVLDPDTTWRIHEATESALLIDGRDYFRAFYAAAVRAKRSILLLGWQFDSDVELLRGRDLPPGMTPNDVELLTLLGRLCRARPELEVRILAWDHSVFFALEREVLQRLYFEVTTGERFHFRWDATVPMGGSHHQKVAIIDGQVAFFGSQDLCQSRWDDSEHLRRNAHRHVRGVSHRPYHEVQVVVSGRAARSLVDLFVARWYGATGEEIDRARLVGEPGSLELATLPVSLPMPKARIGLARTIPPVYGRPAVQEVASLLVRAIGRAERSLYVETQYLTSRVVGDALIARMRDRRRPPLHVVILLPERPERLKEELTIGAAQILFLRVLDEAARMHGHELGVYHVLSGGCEPGERATFVYIHSKLVIVDDDVFIVGSANLTNRSMTIDSEIAAVYEAGADDEVRYGIRRVRARLWGEHAGRLVKRDPRRIEPSLLARAVHELAVDWVDPIPPISLVPHP